GNRTGKEAPRAFLRSGPLKGREPLNPEDEAGHSFLAFSPSDLSHEKCPSERQRGMWITASSRLSYLSKRIHRFAGISTFLARARRLPGFIGPVPPPTLDKSAVPLFTCYSHQKTFTLLYGIRNLPSTDGTIGFPDPRRTEDPGGPQPFPSVVSPKKVHRAASLFSQRNTGFRAAVTSSRRFTTVVWGASWTRSGLSSASRAIWIIASMNRSRVSLLSVSVGSIMRHSSTISGK